MKLRTLLVAAATLAGSAAAAGPAGSAGAPAPEVVTHLLTDWTKVDPGNAVFPIDLGQVTPANRELLEKVYDYYKVTVRLAQGPKPPARINTPHGVRVRPEVARKLGPWLDADRPWETGGAVVGSVLQEGNRYRLWYYCTWTGSDKAVVAPDGRLKLGSDGAGGGVCYAESTDGMQWRKPVLGRVEFRGSKENNILSTTGLGGISGHIFVDPAAPPAERYKVAGVTTLRAYRATGRDSGGILGGAVSPDGFEWQRVPEPLWPTYFNNDGSPSVHFDRKLGKYVLYTRQNYPRRRSIARSQTADFRHWPHPSLILTPGPEEAPSDDFYTNTYFTYPGAENAHLMLSSIYHRDTSRVDVRMASSCDGIVWNWISRDPVIELGAPGAWDGGSIYASETLVRLPDGRVAMPYQGSSWSHNEYWRVKFETGGRWPGGNGWAVWEDGRFAGIEATQEGEFTSQRFAFQGSPIEVNLRTLGTSGSVRVELLVEGEAGPAARSRELVGDRTWTPLEWEGAPDLGRLAGRDIRLRFRLYAAKVFGFRGPGLVARDPLTPPPTEAR
jgi:hypothetical protein